MLGKRFLVGLLPFLLVACAGATWQGTASTSYEGVGNTMENTITTYQALEPRLTPTQKQQFKDAYDPICRAYQTAGNLLAAVMDPADEDSAHTAVVAYQRTVTQLPILVNRASQLVQSFKGSAK